MVVVVLVQPTCIFPGDVADIVDVLDLSFMPHHAHGDGVFAHLRCYILVHLEAQIPEDQVTCSTTVA